MQGNLNGISPFPGESPIYQKTCYYTIGACADVISCTLYHIVYTITAIILSHVFLFEVINGVSPHTCVGYHSD